MFRLLRYEVPVRWNEVCVALLKPNTLRLTAAVIMDIGVLALAIILNY